MKRSTTEFVVKGVITRLALFFQAQGDQKYTGREIARILLSAWFSYEQSTWPGFIAIADATGYVEADAHLGAVEGV